MEEKKHKEVELRSEEVQEVMNHVPKWIVRYGIGVVFSILLLLLLGSYFFKYPDVVTAEITVSTQTPPVYVTAKSTGRLSELYASNKQSVKEGQMLGVIENAAQTEDMLFLIKQLQQWEKEEYNPEKWDSLFNNRHLQLGEVQTAYATFISVVNEYLDFTKQNYYNKRIENQYNQLLQQEKYYEAAQKQHRLMENEETLAHRIYGRDSTLYALQAMHAAEYDESERSYLQSRQNYEGMRMSLVQIMMQIEQSKGNLLDIEHQALTERQKYVVNFKNAIEQLQVGIASWEQHYLLKAPISGTLSFMNIWSNKQNVSAEESIFVIAPENLTPPIGKALLPILGSGKVKVGQTVHIRLNNYPDQEFGYVKGIVHNVSPIPTENNMYIVDIEMPDGLRTNYDKDLPLTREMKGEAEIITEDLRLIERLFTPLKKIAKGMK